MTIHSINIVSISIKQQQCNHPSMNGWFSVVGSFTSINSQIVSFLISRFFSKKVPNGIPRPGNIPNPGTKRFERQKPKNDSKMLQNACPLVFWSIWASQNHQICSKTHARQHFEQYYNTKKPSNATSLTIIFEVTTKWLTIKFCTKTNGFLQYLFRVLFVFAFLNFFLNFFEIFCRICFFFKETKKVHY